MNKEIIELKNIKAEDNVHLVLTDDEIKIVNGKISSDYIEYLYLEDKIELMDMSIENVEKEKNRCIDNFKKFKIPLSILGTILLIPFIYLILLAASSTAIGCIMVSILSLLPLGGSILNFGYLISLFIRKYNKERTLAILNIVKEKYQNDLDRIKKQDEERNIEIIQTTIFEEKKILNEITNDISKVSLDDINNAMLNKGISRTLNKFGGMKK